jgi:hypothetical protein
MRICKRRNKNESLTGGFCELFCRVCKCTTIRESAFPCYWNHSVIGCFLFPISSNLLYIYMCVCVWPRSKAFDTSMHKSRGIWLDSLSSYFFTNSNSHACIPKLSLSVIHSLKKSIDSSTILWFIINQMVHSSILFFSRCIIHTIPYSVIKDDLDLQTTLGFCQLFEAFFKKYH